MRRKDDGAVSVLWQRRYSGWNDRNALTVFGECAKCGARGPAIVSGQAAFAVLANRAARYSPIVIGA